LETLPVGELLRRYRAEARLTQGELAERAGIGARTISDIETGISLRPRAITISLVAEALGLDAQSREALRSASSHAALHRRGANMALPPAIGLVGRDPELATIRTLLLDPTTRLVTLTGGAGVGKTALAIGAATRLIGEFAEQVFFIELGSLPDAILVPTKIALALGVRDVRGDSIAAAIASAIADRSVLLVLDEFERVAPAAAAITELLAATTKLKILATSRSPLHLSMERVLNLSPLSASASLVLLSDRALALGLEAKISERDPACVALMRVLGGVPLAIELAAPLLRNDPPSELAARLKRPLDVLVTMRDAIARSYASLDESEQHVLRALSVFGGPFTEAAAHKVSGAAEVEAPPFNTLRALSTLIDYSLVAVSDDGAEEAEFKLHALVSEFAQAALEHEQETEAAYLRLVDYCGTLVRAVISRPEPPATRARCNRESAHFDAALGWLKSTGRIKRALELAIEMWPIGYRRGEYAHGHAWACSLIAAASDAESIDDGLLANAHWAAAALAEPSGQLEEAARHMDVALPLKRAAGERRGVIRLLAGSGALKTMKGAYSAARAPLEESLAIARELGDGLEIARTLTDLGILASDEGNVAEANAWFDEALSLFSAAGRRMGGSLCLGLLGLVALRSGSPEQAEPLAREAMRVAEEIGYFESAVRAKLVLSRALTALGRLDEAERIALRLAAENELDLPRRADVARILAAIAMQKREAHRAARLLGAASTAPDVPVIPLADRPGYEALRASMAQALGADFEALWSTGRAEGFTSVLAGAQFRQ
jgi:predicted ATPase/transcriptional regulator with XRE-family HTH domain